MYQFNFSRKTITSLMLCIAMISCTNPVSSFQYKSPGEKKNSLAEDCLTNKQNFTIDRVEKIKYKDSTYWEFYLTDRRNPIDEGGAPFMIANVKTEPDGSCLLLNKDMIFARLSYMPERVAVEFSYRYYRRAIEQCSRKQRDKKCIILIEKDLSTTGDSATRPILFPEDLKALKKLGVNTSRMKSIKSIKELYKDRVPSLPKEKGK